MGRLTTIAATEVAAGFDGWIEAGRALMQQRKEVDWQIAQWLKEGRDRFGNERQFQLFEALMIEAKDGRAAIKTFEAFPDDNTRAHGLTFDAHRRVAALPADARLEVLSRADRERWKLEQIGAAVTEYRHQHDLLPEPDPERQGEEIVRAWNRCQPEGRRFAWGLIAPAAKRGFGIIDQEEVEDA